MVKEKHGSGHRRRFHPIIRRQSQTTLSENVSTVLNTVAPLWLSSVPFAEPRPTSTSQAVAPPPSSTVRELAPEDWQIYEGELESLNNGVLGYEKHTEEAAAGGDADAQLAVMAANHALNIYRRDAALTLAPEVLEAIAPEEAVTEEDCGSSSSLTCQVCQEAWWPDEWKRRLPCGHSFHSRCADEWLTKNVGSCPLCRQPLTPTLASLEAAAWLAAADDTSALAAADATMALHAIAEEDPEPVTAAAFSFGFDEAERWAQRSHVPACVYDRLHEHLYAQHLTCLCHQAQCRLRRPQPVQLHASPARHAWLAHRAQLGREQAVRSMSREATAIGEEVHIAQPSQFERAGCPVEA
uniref:RING-type domain-containing protein n=1 Tax=Haptolina ericina TaxID=156174 RepID=A0A7S3F533_9EUKA